MNRAQRIDAGVAYLDHRVDGWWEQVNLDILDMGDGTACVVGQTITEYCSFWQGHLDKDTQLGIDLGFDLPGELDYDHPSYSALTTAWATKIRRLRKERAAA